MGRIFDRVRGHQKIINTLLKAKQDKRLSHAMLFIGSSGIGKKNGG